MNRREFLKRAARGITLGGLVIMGITLGRSRPKADTQKGCRIDLPCRQCSKREGCSDPKYLKQDNPPPAPLPADRMEGE